jgi:hypothetical protein
VQVISVFASAILLIVVFDLVRRRRLLEPYAVLWLVASIALLIATFKRDAIDKTAGWIGVYYPPAALLLMLTFAVFVIALWFSIVISRQQRQVDRLIEEAAVLSGELRELRKASSTETAPDYRARPKTPDA